MNLLRPLGALHYRSSDVRLFIKLGSRNHSELQLLYQPPSSTVAFLLELLDYTSGLAVEFLRFIVLGNFNLPSIGMGSEVAQGCMATIMAMGLSQINQSLTWHNSHTLELVFLLKQWQCNLKLGDLLGISLVMVG